MIAVMFLTQQFYYYSETQPEESGYYWHWAEDGVTPIVWTI